MNLVVPGSAMFGCLGYIINDQTVKTSVTILKDYTSDGQKYSRFPLVCCSVRLGKKFKELSLLSYFTKEFWVKS